ncbi:AAA family ATPase [Marinospirillum insulare]|uniref:Cell division protein n=1 Tax=Marinospirillum insulare TaxID=217169 RepID=A0ABQ5ZX85_9GAMM|nr:AAA family ATPase [Marinospirillum insulare]GLR63688.1 cell division protein [Marinospirillum insulare]
MQPREPSLSSSTPFNEQALLLEHVNDAAVFYSGKQHGKHLDLLLHLSRYSNLLLTVTGQQGSGKTHLKNRMLQQLDSGVVVSLLDAEQTASAAQVLPTLAQNLNIEIPAKADFDFYIAEIRNFSSQLSEEGGSCLIVIDNAENLEQDAINLILELATTASDNHRPHLALFGSQALFTKLHQKENLSRFESVGHHLPLEAFNEAEARNYLDHRCKSVGIDTFPLDDQQFTKAYKASKGLPGLLNSALVEQLRNGSDSASLAPSLISPKKSKAKKTKTTTQPKKAKPNKKGKLPLGFILAATSLVALLLVGYLYKDQLQPSSTPDTSLISRPQEIRQGEAAWQPPALPEQSKVTNEPQPEETPLPTDQAETQQPTEVTAQAEASVESPVLEENTSGLDLPDDTPLATQPSVEEPAKPTKPTVEPKKPTAPKKLAEKAPAKKPTWVDKGARREASLMAKPATHYTLQMMGSLDEASVKSFIQSQTTNRSDFSYFEGRYKGQPWYVVVYGDYSNRDQALAGIQKLPKSLQKQRPWARSYQSVQDDLRSH